MAQLVDRLPMLVEIRGENRQIVRANAEDSNKDKTGSCTNMLALDLRFFAIADYVLKGDVVAFKSQLLEASNLRKQLIARFENGESIDPSYVTMIAYKSLFDSLAVGDFDISKELASHLGGHDALEKEYDHPFDYAMGYTLRSFVLNDTEEMQKWTPIFTEACRESNMIDFDGYGQVFQAIIEGKSVAANQGLRAIVKGHQKQSKGKGVFANTEDEALCVWGIGMANLAIGHGLTVDAIPPLIPQDLLVGDVSI